MNTATKQKLRQLVSEMVSNRAPDEDASYRAQVVTEVMRNREAVAFLIEGAIALAEEAVLLAEDAENAEAGEDEDDDVDEDRKDLEQDDDLDEED